MKIFYKSLLVIFLAIFSLQGSSQAENGSFQCYSSIPTESMINSQKIPNDLNTVSMSIAIAEMDVLVAYDQDSRISAAFEAGLDESDHSAILAKVNEHIETTNTIFENSKVYLRLNLVGTHETTYDYQFHYPGLYWYLPQDAMASLRVPDDGVMDEILLLKDQYQADFVSVLLNFGGIAGYGTHLVNPEDPFYYAPGPSDFLEPCSLQECAMSISDWQPSSLYYLFSHEMGHSLGMHHAPAYGPDPNDFYVAFPFSFAHIFTAGTPSYLDYYFKGVESETYMTVMSGTDEFIPIPYYSNPLVQYMGVPTGIFYERDNAKTVNYFRFYLENIR